MKRLSAITMGLLVFGFVAMVSAQAGWITLFDGKNLNNFNVIGKAEWKLVDGAVEGSGSAAGFLVSKESYGDFDLKAEIWVDAPANSGIFIRASNPAEVAAANAYEVNIYDKRPDPSYRTGAIVDVAKPLVQVNAANKWNTLEISARGTHMVITMNGVKTAEGDDKKWARGPFALQYGSGVVKFRNVQIRPIK